MPKAEVYHVPVAGGGFKKVKGNAPVVVGVQTNIQNSNIGSGLNQVQYIGPNWTAYPSDPLDNEGIHYTGSADSYLLLKFYGNKIVYYGTKETFSGILAWSVDGGVETMVDAYNDPTVRNQKVFEVVGLSEGEHTLKVRCTGQKRPDAVYPNVTFDYAVATSLVAPPVTPSTPSANNGQPSVPGAPTLTLSWSDEFEGSSLDLAKWSYGEPDEVTQTGFGGAKGYNRNQGWAAVPAPASNLQVSNSTLKMIAKRDALASNNGQVMSTVHLTSRGKYDQFIHGYAELRCRTPKGKGLWPAWWGLGNTGYGNGPSWPECLEHDFIEQYNNEEISGVDTMNLIHGKLNDTTIGGVSGTIKYDSRRRGAIREPGPLYTVRPYVLDEQWHTHTIHRTSTFYRKYVDGVLIYEYVPGEMGTEGYKDNYGGVPPIPLPQRLFDEPMHMRFDIQIGDLGRYRVPQGTPGAVYNPKHNDWVIWEEGTFEVDYLRVWNQP